MAAKTSFRFHRKAQHLALWNWGSPDAANGSQNVLFSQGSADIAKGEVGLFEALRIQPEAIREFTAAEDPHITDAWCAEQRVPKGLVQPAREKGGDVLIRRVAEPQDHQQVFRGAPHLEPLARHGLRQPAAGQVHLVLNLDRIQLGITRVDAQRDAGAALPAG